MSRPYRLAFAAIMAAFTCYVASYWYIRQSNTVLHVECDGCPVDGWEEVMFPVDGGFIVYAPLYQLDKSLSSSSDEFSVIRKE